MLSDIFQTIVRQSSVRLQALVKNSSGSRQAVGRQSAGSRQAVGRQLAGSQQAVDNQTVGRQLAGSHQEVMKLSFFHIIAQPMGLKAISVLFVLVTVSKMAFFKWRGKPKVQETFCHGGEIVCFALKMRFLSAESNT